MTHGNIVHQAMANQVAFGCLGEGETAVNWAPQYHDLGLVVCILSCAFAGVRLVMFSPLDFIRNPMLWLRAISKYSAAYSAAPNSAYAYAARRGRRNSDALKSLRLDSWRIAGNGGEPVTKDALDAFADVFAPCGFDARAHFPCFALRSTRLWCSGRKRYRLPTMLRADADALALGMVREEKAGNAVRVLVGCGEPFHNVRIRIVDVESLDTVRGSNAVGEVWLSSPSVAQGYWKVESEDAFVGDRAKSGDLMDEISFPSVDFGTDWTESWVRTGDLGFLHRGELFICGRLKDMIIVNGRNIFPQDIESTAEGTDARLRRGCSAAFATSEDSAEVCIVVEFRRPPDERRNATWSDGILQELLRILKTRSLMRTLFLLRVSFLLARKRCRNRAAAK